MAKKTTVQIDVLVNGKMQKATVDARKLRDALDGVDRGAKRTGKSTGELDRNLKGTAKATSNTTKEFAKMSQGMGGLVAVYAQIAAASFAVSAAFLFLKDAMDVRNLMEGQKAFGAVTGVAYQTLTKDIREATDGMLGFRDAAQAAAIGTAAGLSRGQLEQLGAAAKNTSFALGRDLTDSFNRLVRGVTKAEPELLDELGIILRLDPALKAYSVAIGKNVKDLNQFEKSQAIANEVLTQAEQKFGAIQKIMDPNAAALAQFEQSFRDLMDSFKSGLADTLIPVFNFLKDNTMSLVGALSLIALPIVRQILPNFELMGKAANKAYARASRAADAAKADAATFAATASLAAGGTEARSSVMTSSAARGKGIGIDVKGKLAEEGMLSKRQLNIYRKLLNDKERMRKRFTAKERIEFRAFMAEQEALHATSNNKRLSVTQRTEMGRRALHAQTVALYKAGQAMMVAATEKAAKGMNRVMKFAGFAGLALMLFDLGRMLKDMLFPMSEAEKEAERLKEEINGAMEAQQTLNDELSRMVQVADSFEINLGVNERITQVQQALQSVDVNKLMIDYATLGKGNEELAQGYAKTALELGRLTGNQMFNKLADAMESQSDIGKELKKDLLNYANAAIQAGIAVSQLGELAKATNAAFQQAAPSGLQFAGVATAVKSEIDALRLAQQAQKDMVKQEEDRLASLDLANKDSDKARIKQLEDWMATRRDLLTTQGRDIDVGADNRIEITGGRGGASARNREEFAYNMAADEYNLLVAKVEETEKAEQALKDAREANNKVLGQTDDRLTRLVDIQSAITKIQNDGLAIQRKGITQDIKAEKLKSNNALFQFEKDKQKLDIEQKKRELAVEQANQQLRMANLGAKLVGKTYEELKALEAKGELTDQEERAALYGIELAQRQVDLAETKRDVAADLLDMEKKLLDIKEQEKILDLGSLELQLRKGKAMVGATSVQQRVIERNDKQAQLQLQRANLMLKFQEEMAKTAERRDDAAVASLLLQMDLITQQEAALIRQADTMTAVADAMNEAFQTGVQSGLESLITGDEKSFKDAALKLGEAVARAGVKKLVERITEDLFTKEEDKPENKIKLAMMQAADYHAKAIQAAIEGKPLPGAPTNGTGSEPVGLPEKPRKYGKEVAKEWGAFTDSVSDVFATGTGASFIERIGMAFGRGGVLLQTAFGGLFAGLSSMLAGLFSGGGSTASQIFGMVASAAIGAFAPGVGSGSGSGSGNSGPPIRDVPKVNQQYVARYGGVFSSSGKVPGYAVGGIAKGPQAGYPAMLHGTEAVVPLPNNKSIPVDLKGAGQNNNVVVNVSMDNKGGATTDTQADGNDGRKLGTLIAASVQRELHNQKRAGGILNPMGAS